ncbi:MAG: HD domain-containing protein [Proteobacteria bacterium]|nr:MAG: HD domain-containing protein [Pseudomonadota bacterium]
MMAAKGSAQGDSVHIAVERKDLARFQFLIQTVRELKVKALLEKEPTLDRKTIEIFSNLSGASQMIIRGGITRGVALEARAATTKLIDNLMDSHVAIGTLSRMILVDSTLYDHSAAVAMLSGVISRNLMGYSKEDAESCARGGLYHDVGKTCVPNAVLNKPGSFTPEEFEVMKTHATHGYEELQKAIEAGAPIDHDVARVAYEHHEKFSGGGYPNGRKGRFEDDPASGIHRYARVVSVADVYSALLMKRVYKDAFTQEKALEIMSKNAPNDYDPMIWEPFEKSVSSSVEYFNTLNRSNYVGDGRILLLDQNKLRDITPKRAK